jgi:hypothetical protein
LRAGCDFVLLCALLLLGLTRTTFAAGADADDPGEAQIRRGLELRKAGQDDQAFEAFRSAYKLKASPRAQAQMGMAEQALGRWVDAEKDLKGALAVEQDAWIARNSATLKRSLATVAEHLGSVQIVGSPAGARVVIDERDVGRLPIDGPVRVPAGEVLVTVSASGYVDISRKITVGAGSLAREVIALHALAATAAARAPAAPVEPSAEISASDDKTGVSMSPTAGISSEGKDRDAAPSEVPGLTTVQGWAIGAGALGVVAAGVGTLFALQAISKNDASRTGCIVNACDEPGAQARRDALTAGNRATVAFVVGGVLFAGGVAAFFAGRPSPAGGSSTASVVPAVGLGRLALVGTFRF